MVLALLAIELLFLHQLYVGQKGNPQNQGKIWFWACASVWFFTAFRSFTTGNDTYGYILSFENIKQISWHEVFHTIEYRDPFFVYFVKLCTIILRSSQVYLAFTAFLSYIGVFILFREKAKFPVLALFFYVTLTNFLFNITGIRQAIAMSMCMLAVSFMCKKKLLPFCLFVLLGMVFHHSAAIFFPVYYIGKLQVNQKWLALYIIGLGVSIVLFENILGYANALLRYDYGVEEVDSGKIFLFILLAIEIISYLYKEKWLPSDSNREMFIIMTVCLALWVCRLFSRVAERPSFYFLSVVPIMWTNTLGLVKDTQKKNIYLILSIMISLLLFLKRISSFSYHFTWQG
ncbi:MAG: EpsG family protein [Victivallales bacterium]|nr:EpsG family protein [Victivallales bacterium]